MAGDKTLIGEYADPLTGASRVSVVLGLLVISLFMGTLIGLFVQVMLQVMNLCIGLLWNSAGGLEAMRWLPLLICPVGGLIIGAWNAYFHAAPESLEHVMATVKETGGYRVGKVPAAIVAFLLPLAFGGAVGPEAGLTGFIAGAATRISATLRRAGLRAKSLADVTVSATICAIFGAPFAGLVATAEHMPIDVATQQSKGPSAGREQDAADAPSALGKSCAPDEAGYTYRRGVKVVLYGISAAGAFFGMWVATLLVGRGGGLPHFDVFSLGSPVEAAWIFACIAAGYVLALAFGGATCASAAVAQKIGEHDIIKGLIAGVLLGILGTALPYVLFSGEEQAREIVEAGAAIPALLLVATAFAKVVMTPLCIEMGWRGGTIFPCIFAGVALGLGIATLFGANALFCVTCTCAAFMGAKTRKPVLAVALLLLCFPPESVPWMIAAALVGSFIPQPRVLKAQLSNER